MLELLGYIYVLSSAHLDKLNVVNFGLDTREWVCTVNAFKKKKILTDVVHDGKSKTDLVFDLK